MLLKEEREESNIICYFDSSNIIACKYLSDISQLLVIFKGGTQYLYDKVSNYTFQRFKIAKSQGVALNEHLKNKFNCQKVAEGMDLTEILTFIEELKKAKN